MMDSLRRRNIHVGSSACKLCDETMETTIHLFGSCNMVQQVWDFIQQWCRLKPIFILELKDLVKMQTFNQGSKKWRMAVYFVIQTTIWVIWGNRNDAIFSNKRLTSVNIKQEV
ncbi:putative reverse transcriptase zinc-binding domain-containing protein [Helianthus annuus]|nr:putative reverse transcriptase zinc-binding domain-containing protein [Helianthus annuus]